MDTPSLFFLIVFTIPLVVLLFWIIKKDKKNRKWGYIVLSIIVIAALYVAFFKAPSYSDFFPNV
jgi:uncharacterized membrane protein